MTNGPSEDGPKVLIKGRPQVLNDDYPGLTVPIDHMIVENMAINETKCRELSDILSLFDGQEVHIAIWVE